MVLGKLPASYNLDGSRARAYCACSSCGWEFFGHFTLLYLFSPNPSIWKRGWSGGAKVLGKLSVPGRPTSLNDSREKAYCACSRCGWGFVWTFLLSSVFFSFLSPSLWETARYRLRYCLKGPLNPKQPTNQPTIWKTA